MHDIVISALFKRYCTNVDNANQRPFSSSGNLYFDADNFFCLCFYDFSNK